MDGNRKKAVWLTACVLFILVAALSFLNTSSVVAMIRGSKAEVATTIDYENIALGKTYALYPTPNYSETATPGNANKVLTDGKFSPDSGFWGQKTTVGWDNNRIIIITFDLGEVQPIMGVSFRTSAGGKWMHWPFAAYVLVSNDNQKYYYAGDLIAMNNAARTPPEPNYVVYRFWTDAMKTHGRYVKLVVDTDGKNFFTDEIEIYRGKTEWISAPFTGKPTSGGVDYIYQYATDNGVRTRLRMDIEEARQAVANSGLSKSRITTLQQELKELESQIAKLGFVDPKNFRAVMPLNDLQAKIYALVGKMHKMQGSSPLQAWVTHPYDYLVPTQLPDKNSLRNVELSLMKGEWRYATINIANSTDQPSDVYLNIERLPGGTNPNYIKVFQVEWTATREQIPIATALTEVNCGTKGYRINVPAGIVRQVWFTFHPVDITSGKKQGQITVKGSSTIKVPVEMNLFALNFPQTPTLHLGGWDHTDGSYFFGVTDITRNPLAAHLQERFVDTTWADPQVLEVGDFDSNGNMYSPSTERFDEWVERWPKARRYCINLESQTEFAGVKIGTDDFNYRVRQWLNFWLKHAAQKGISPNQIVLCPVDEPYTKQEEKIAIAWAQAIHDVQPQVLVWENPINDDPKNVSAQFYDSINILSPPRRILLTGGKEVEAFYQSQQKAGKLLGIYSGCGPLHEIDPYSGIRLQAWSVWTIGGDGSSFWSFGDRGGRVGGPWNPYIALRPNCAPVFLDDFTVTPAKHMEAVRESVEDYEYFVLLAEAIKKADKSNPAVAQAQKLLENGPYQVLNATGADKTDWSEYKDRWVAEKVREQILAMLIELR